jgi:hypothetical protein
MSLPQIELYNQLGYLILAVTGQDNIHVLLLDNGLIDPYPDLIEVTILNKLI